MRKLLALGCMAAVLAAPTGAQAAVDDCVAAPTDRYGVAGSNAVGRVLHFANPELALLETTVYAPAGSGPWPVVMFAHAFAAGDPETYYRPFIDRLVSRGVIVVYSEYSTLHAVLARGDAYDQLWAGFEQAVERYGSELGMDLTRVGFVGHSYGAGATPEMFRRGVVERGWGAQGRFMLMFAPYAAHEISAEQMADFPSDTKLLIQVYDDDDTNDHRFAIEQIWKPLTSIPPANRDYVLVRSAGDGACSLPADHGVPMTGGGRYGKLDAYDAWAVWRHAAALTGCAFHGDPAGCEIALGHGSPEQTYMGEWLSNRTLVTPLESMAEPVPANCQPGERCTFRHRGALG